MLKTATKASLILSTLALGSVAFSYIDATVGPMTREKLVSIFKAHPEVTTLEKVPEILPPDFLMNFVLKHGVKRAGERGHLIEKKVSQSSDPMAPRAILFDERTGFTVSYNGGTAGQTAGDRLDVLSFDPVAKNFKFEGVEFPIKAGQPEFATTDCASCHGEKSRPIFAMYPDWPSFYGSDNDEITGVSHVQEIERKDYNQFRNDVVPHAPRYTPLFSEKRVKERLGIEMYPTFPYRQNSSTEPLNISRSFAFRPALRLGIVYNRQVAQSVAKRVIEHANYKKFGAYFLFNIYACDWSSGSASLQKIWADKVQGTLGKTPTFKGGRLDYRQMWQLFDLRINDVDIRYSYNHEGYDQLSAHGKVMEVGYIGNYFNSYFDGSTTIDELMSAAIYTDLAAKNRGLVGVATPRGLDEKYQRFAARYKFDKSFFRQIDSMGKWLAIPYPTEIAAPQHRERFTTELMTQHQHLCSALERGLK